MFAFCRLSLPLARHAIIQQLISAMSQKGATAMGDKSPKNTAKQSKQKEAKKKK
jgi:hypothetical protein